MTTPARHDFDLQIKKEIEYKQKEMEQQKQFMARKSQQEKERAQKDQTRAYAEPILEAQVQRSPRQPLTYAQIDRAVVMAEIARRGIAAVQDLSPAQALERVSAQPRARLRQDHLDSTLDSSAPSRPSPRM